MQSKGNLETNRYEVFRLNGTKFNILLAAFCFLIAPFLIPQINLSATNALIGLFGLFFYFAEWRAFLYKLKMSRARILMELTGNHPGKLDVALPGIGFVLMYGYILRLVFRVAILIIVLTAFGFYRRNSEDSSVVFSVVMIVGVLFEVFVLMQSMVLEDSFGSRNSRDGKEEIAWRKKHFALLNDDKTILKEVFSDLVLLISALMFTHLFWNLANELYIEYIDLAFLDGTDGSTVFWWIFLTNIPLCFFMLAPVRLAYWVVEAMGAIDSRARWKLRLTFLLAAFGITSPIFRHFFEVYFGW